MSVLSSLNSHPIYASHLSHTPTDPFWTSCDPVLIMHTGNPRPPLKQAYETPKRDPLCLV